MAGKNGGACHVCLLVPSSGRLNIDHEHVKGWKKLQPSHRASHVRGLLCYICNFRLLTRGVTLDKLKRAAAYLEAHQAVRLGGRKP